MNIRKPVDYSAMYAAIDTLMVSDMEQTKLFCEIGRLIDERTEKGSSGCCRRIYQYDLP